MLEDGRQRDQWLKGISLSTQLNQAAMNANVDSSTARHESSNAEGS